MRTLAQIEAAAMAQAMAQANISPAHPEVPEMEPAPDKPKASPPMRTLQEIEALAMAKVNPCPIALPYLSTLECGPPSTRACFSGFILLPDCG